MMSKKSSAESTKDFPRGVITFRELLGSPASAPSILENKGRIGAKVANLCAKYMRDGFGLAAAPARMRDVFDKDQYPSDTPGWSTDGEWLWHSSLPYYVSKYRVGLPADFVALITDRQGMIPPVSRKIKDIGLREVLIAVNDWSFSSS